MFQKEKYRVFLQATLPKTKRFGEIKLLSNVPHKSRSTSIFSQYFIIYAEFRGIKQQQSKAAALFQHSSINFWMNLLIFSFDQRFLDCFVRDTKCHLLSYLVSY